MKRRSFVRLSGIGLSGSMVIPSFLVSSCDKTQNYSPQLSNSVKVVVIGAGISGLAAARYLKDRGAEVTVVEAQNRIGGRIWTDRSQGFPFDKGASWIHGPNGNPITPIASQAGAATFLTNDESVKIYNTSGVLFDDEVIESYDTAHNRILSDAKSAGTRAKSLANAIKETTPSALEDLLAQYMLTAYTEFDTGGPLEELSSLYFDYDEKFSGEDVMFPGGYDAVINHLAKDINIELGQEVTEIRYSEGTDAEVITASKTYTASYVVVSLPLGVLKKEQVTFTPALPASKTEAIGRLKMGYVNKVALEFPDAFWETDLQYIGFASEEKGKFPLFLNYRTFSDFNVLMSFGFGNFGLAMESMTDQAIVTEIMTELKAIYGEAIPEPTSYQITRWSSDPYSCGAYSFMAAGAGPEDFLELAKPINSTLFFAGEHTTDEYWGTVHGAYLTGIEAAEQIYDLASENNRMTKQK